MFRIRFAAPFILGIAVTVSSIALADPIQPTPAVNPQQASVTDYLSWDRINRIPEPASMTFLGIGSISLGSFLRRRFKGEPK